MCVCVGGSLFVWDSLSRAARRCARSARSLVGRVPGHPVWQVVSSHLVLWGQAGAGCVVWFICCANPYLLHCVTTPAQNRHMSATSCSQSTPLKTWGFTNQRSVLRFALLPADRCPSSAYVYARLLVCTSGGLAGTVSQASHVSTPSCVVHIVKVRSRYLKGPKDAQPPHIYFLAYNGYETMLRTKYNQSFVIRCATFCLL